MSSSSIEDISSISWSHFNNWSCEAPANMRLNAWQVTLWSNVWHPWSIDLDNKLFHTLLSWVSFDTQHAFDGPIQGPSCPSRPLDWNFSMPKCIADDRSGYLWDNIKILCSYSARKRVKIFFFIRIARLVARNCLPVKCFRSGRALLDVVEYWAGLTYRYCRQIYTTNSFRGADQSQRKVFDVWRRDEASVVWSGTFCFWPGPSSIIIQFSAGTRYSSFYVNALVFAVNVEMIGKSNTFIVQHCRFSLVQWRCTWYGFALGGNDICLSNSCDFLGKRRSHVSQSYAAQGREISRTVACRVEKDGARWRGDCSFPLCSDASHRNRESRCTTNNIEYHSGNLLLGAVVTRSIFGRNYI